MYLTGFADEAAADIDGQIRATKQLGWSRIEMRNVDGVNLHDLPEDKFEEVYGKLADAGIEINCFGSAIANWAKSILRPYDDDLASAKRAVVRMKRLGTKFIRIMSYPPIPDKPMEEQMAEERFRRLREICAPFLDAGLQPLQCSFFFPLGIDGEDALNVALTLYGTDRNAAVERILLIDHHKLCTRCAFAGTFQHGKAGPRRSGSQQYG